MFKKLWKQLRSDWVRVLMAFVLGCLIYLLRSNVFSSSVESREFSNITVNLEYPNANIINLDNKKPVAAVTLEGTPHRIQKLTPEQIIIKADVEQTHLNSGLIELTEKNIKVPFGIRVKSINTPRILVNLDIIESKKVKVSAVFDSVKNLSENYSIAKTAIIPREVMISGPRSKIKDIREVRTAPIPLDSTIQDNFQYTAAVAPLGSDIISVPSMVKCEITIARNFSKRVIKKVPVRMLIQKNTDLKFVLNPATVDIEISGPARIVHFLSTNDFDAFVNADNITKPGEYILNIRCMPHSKDIQIISITPIQLTLNAR